MYRKYIRDHRTDQAPRVFDYVREDDGTEMIEIKIGSIKKTILLPDMEEQIKKAKNSS